MREEHQQDKYQNFFESTKQVPRSPQAHTSPNSETETKRHNEKNTSKFLTKNPSPRHLVFY